MTSEIVAKGLAGVVVEETSISDVQSAGKLTYRGVDIAELTQQHFLQVAEWVVCGSSQGHFTQLLQDSSNLTKAETSLVLNAGADLHPMSLLQGVVPLLSAGPDLGFGEANQGLHVAAKLPAVILTHLHQRPVVLDSAKEYTERFVEALASEGVRKLSGPISAELVKAVDVAQILQLEHSLNAGTFAARVVSSTLANVQAAISAGIGALSGPLHGGADQAVLEIADTLADENEARVLVRRTIDEGGKIPGMGHREYRVRDPRAVALETLAERLIVGSEYEPTYRILQAIEDEFRSIMGAQGKALHANVEFYKGLVYRAAGLPNHYFTAGFAMARVFGYIAHFIESRRDNRIYRPAARYVPAAA